MFRVPGSYVLQGSLPELRFAHSPGYLYLYIHIHIQTCLYIYIYIYVYTYTYICAYKHAHTDAHAHAHTHPHTHTPTHPHTHTPTHPHTHTLTHSHTHTPTHPHTHTPTYPHTHAHTVPCFLKLPWLNRAEMGIWGFTEFSRIHVAECSCADVCCCKFGASKIYKNPRQRFFEPTSRGPPPPYAQYFLLRLGSEHVLHTCANGTSKILAPTGIVVSSMQRAHQVTISSHLIRSPSYGNKIFHSISQVPALSAARSFTGTGH